MAIRNFFEMMSGTRKQKYGEDLFNPAEYQRLRDEQDRLYGEYGDRRQIYSDRENRFLSDYDNYNRAGDRYRDTSERYLGKAGSSFDSASGLYDRSAEDIGRARERFSRADAMLDDREYYRDLQRRSDRRRRAIEADRLELESLRGDVGRPVRDTGMSQILLDAFNRANVENKRIMEANTSQLKKMNPVAAAKLVNDFNNDTLKSIGQIKQNANLSERDIQNSRIGTEANLLLNANTLLNREGQEDQLGDSYRRSLIGDIRSSAGDSLNLSSAGLNEASARLDQGTRYRGLSSDFQGLSSREYGRGSNALNASLNYGNAGDRMLDNQTSITNFNTNQLDKFRLSDRAARDRVDSFNNQRANMGLNNTLNLIKTGAEVSGAVSSYGMNQALINRINAGNPPPTTPTDSLSQTTTNNAVNTAVNPVAKRQNNNDAFIGFLPGTPYNPNLYNRKS